jgi:hypothetical protein
MGVRVMDRCNLTILEVAGLPGDPPLGRGADGDRGNIVPHPNYPWQLDQPMWQFNVGRVRALTPVEWVNGLEGPRTGSRQEKK